MEDEELPALTPNAITTLHRGASPHGPRVRLIRVDEFQTNTSGVQEPVVVQVTEILRYLCDRSWLALTRLPLSPNQRPPCSYPSLLSIRTFFLCPFCHWRPRRLS